MRRAGTGKGGLPVGTGFLFSVLLWNLHPYADPPLLSGASGIAAAIFYLPVGGRAAQRWDNLGAIAAVPSGRGRGALLLLSAHAWNECAFLLRHGVPGYFVQPVFNQYLSGYLRHILQAGEAPGGEKPQRSLTGTVPGVFLSSML